MATPIATVRVLELTHDLSVQVCGMLLADFGATVSHLQPPPPGSTERRRLENISTILTRGKKRIAAGLDLSLGDSLLRQAVEGTDVILMGPSLSHEEARQLADKAKQFNALLIDIHMPTFPEDLTDHYGPANTDGAVAAATGLFTDISLFRSVLGLPPAYTDLPMPSIYGAVHGAIAVLASLRARQAANAGDTVKVPLASAVITSMASGLLEVCDQPARYDLPPVPRVVKNIVLPMVRTLARFGGAGMRQKISALGDKLFPPFMRTYTTADNKQLYLFAMDHDKLPATLLDCLGISQKLQCAEIGISNPYRSTRTDNLADPAMLAKPIKKELSSLIASKIATETAAFWEERLTIAGIPFAVHRTFGEWCAQEEVRKAGLITSCTSPDGNRLAMPGKFVTIGGNTGSNPPAAPGNASKPLEGIKVLDLSTMVAGPVCARTLAELGAEVIKVDSPTPRHGPRMTCWYGLEVNQGKKTLLLDISQKEGADAFSKVMSKAHVVVHNFSDRAARKLGLDAASLQRKAPHILLCSVGAFQGEHPALWDGRKGYDPVIQAATGIQMRYGTKAAPQLHAIASCIDYLTGYVASMGVMAALEMGQKRVSASLAQAAQLIQILYFSEENEQLAPSGQDAVGLDVDNRIYRTKDGYIFLAATAEQSGRVNGILKTPAGTALDRQRAFSQKTSGHWLDLFRKAQISLVEVGSTRDYALLGSTTARTITRDHPSGHRVTQLAQGHMISNLWKLGQLEAYEKPGTHTVEILKDAGLADQAIDVLLACKTAGERWSEKYLP